MRLLDSISGKFKKKSLNIITFILVGILLLIIAMPVKKENVYDNGTVSSDTSRESVNATNEAESIASYDSYASYYETRLKAILEKSYGEGTMEVMVSLAKPDSGSAWSGSGYGGYGNSYSYSEERSVDGVLVVAKLDDASAMADISFAVCALFDLPAHKVAVMIR